ncbi:hypothetical protein WJX74_008178 [Apatococcus lobatus]|uniref:E2F-associated phosphoprotein n=1 Tax=Apatococcus lobatus TaxID=904363 RepID=A0AAW1S9R4_9CHLO
MDSESDASGSGVSEPLRGVSAATESAAQGPEFYDPELDEEDERWVDQCRQGRQSDAILSCPGCLATICLECQAHAQYEHQYRAIEVISCRVARDKPVPLPASNRSRKRNHQRQQVSSQHQAPEVFFPVLCDACNTQVGVQDADEVYHLYQPMCHGRQQEQCQHGFSSSYCNRRLLSISVATCTAAPILRDLDRSPDG